MRFVSVTAVCSLLFVASPFPTATDAASRWAGKPSGWSVESLAAAAVAESSDSRSQVTEAELVV